MKHANYKIQPDWDFNLWIQSHIMARNGQSQYFRLEYDPEKMFKPQNRYQKGQNS